MIVFDSNIYLRLSAFNTLILNSSSWIMNMLLLFKYLQHVIYWNMEVIGLGL